MLSVPFIILMPFYSAMPFYSMHDNFILQCLFHSVDIILDKNVWCTFAKIMVNPAKYASSDAILKRNVMALMDEFEEELKTMSGKCMDIGCGPGDITKNITLPSLDKSAVMIGTDILKDMVKYANEKYSEDARIVFEVLDVQTKCLPTKYISEFNNIFSFHALNWCSNIRQAFNNIYEMLQPGGTMFVNLVASHDLFDVFIPLSQNPRYAFYMPVYVVFAVESECACRTAPISCTSFFQEASDSQARKGRFLFDDLFGIDITSSADVDEERLRNCTCECGLSNQENRIVGGRPTIPNRYPWVARIVYDGRFHCGASLLNNDYVITAAHCLRRLKRSKIRIVLGDYDQYVNTDGVAVMRAVSAVIRHRNFDISSFNHDVALLRLRKSVKFSKKVRPVCLPQPDTDPAGKEGTVVGWGRTSEGGMLPAKVHEVQVPIYSLSQCRKMKYRANRITDNMICAGRGGQDSCQGDSGGPLLVQEADKLEIAGIVSWGVGCGKPGYPGVYTRVSRYLKWIHANMKDGCLCAN
ncbi:PREDICTED: serine protease hepsin-like [Dinoponera quadriceps]|uniref:Serine protease hepsin-like n=1 Tax=Dinoponera quadriceps TaxID=609295 RepID=A0A6P3WN95_DINQU|nr:PREDICTED: serine protease hepsin-like [Dinoponera quadriceps]